MIWSTGHHTSLVTEHTASDLMGILFSHCTACYYGIGLFGIKHYFIFKYEKCDRSLKKIKNVHCIVCIFDVPFTLSRHKTGCTFLHLFVCIGDIG